MLFNSVGFLIFFPIVLLVYYAIPQRIRYLWLLAASYYFYMCWNAKYALLILTSTVITYTSGLLLEKVKRLQVDELRKIRYKKSVVVLSFVSNLGILCYFKYVNFFLFNLSRVFALIHL
ncbi:MAG: MBOAT family protein, partial [Clostridia bacterium]|nr:MBOAT family protein [Clostridia bacterium]